MSDLELKYVIWAIEDDLVYKRGLNRNTARQVAEAISRDEIRGVRIAKEEE